MSDSDGNGKKFDFAVQGASTTPPTKTVSPACITSLLRGSPLLFNLEKANVLHDTGDPGRGKILFQSMDSNSSFEQDQHQLHLLQL